MTTGCAGGFRFTKNPIRLRLQQNRHIAYLGDGWRNFDYVFTGEDGYVMNPQAPTKQFDHFLKWHGNAVTEGLFFLNFHEYSPSVSFADSSPYTGEPSAAAGTVQS